MPGLQALVGAVMESAQQIANVLVLFVIVFAFVAIQGIILFQGNEMHSRCRLTPYPVNLTYPVGQNVDPEPYRCLEVSNFDNIRQEPLWTKDKSPWAHAQDCFWPIDNKNNRFCSESKAGLNICPSDVPDVSKRRWCGSNYDALGNIRFTSSGLDHSDTLGREEYIPDLYYGFTNFDDFGSSLVVLFQVITLSGWSNVMYFVQDCIGDGLGAAYFVLLAFVGFYIMVQLLLATLTENYHGNPVKKEETNSKYLENNFLYRLYDQYFPVVNEDAFPVFRKKIRSIVLHDYFDNFVVFMIVVNTAVLSSDHYPSTTEYDNVVDGFNFGLMILFNIEMILKVTGLGVREYTYQYYNVMDAIISIFSLLEILILPPPILGGSQGSSGSLSALRSFRLVKLFRIFSAMGKNKKLKTLINALVTTAQEMQNFLILLFLLLYIYTLLGMQLFANKLRFDDKGYVISEIGSDAWINAPEYWVTNKGRYNFDDFPSSFSTVFQIVTMDNWEVCMHALRRSQGALGVFYAISLVIVGSFVLMNLFLAILLHELSVETHKIVKGEKHKALQEIRNVVREDGYESKKLTSRASSREALAIRKASVHVDRLAYFHSVIRNPSPDSPSSRTASSAEFSSRLSPRNLERYLTQY